MANTGTVKVEWSRPSRSFPVGRLSFAWTSTGSGVVAYTMTDYVAGTLGKLVTNPGTTAPESNYDITITDEDAVDILVGTGANRHTSNTETVYPTVAGSAAGSGSVQVDFAGMLTLNVTNASTGLVARSGVTTIYYH